MAFSYDAGTSTPNLAGLIEVGSIRINDGTFELLAASGLLLGAPGVRPAVALLPADHGGSRGTPRYNPRDIQLEGRIRVPTAADLWAAIDLLFQAFNLDAGLKTLTVNTSGWSAARQIAVDMAEAAVRITPPNDLDSHAIGNRYFTVDLVAPDPRFYATSVTSETIATGTPVTNNGKASSPITVRFNGPQTNPELNGPGTGNNIKIGPTAGVDVAIASGHWIEVSTNPAAPGGVSALDDTGANRYGDVSIFSGSVIAPGVSSWSATNDTGAGSTVLKFRDAWT